MKCCINVVLFGLCMFIFDKLCVYILIELFDISWEIVCRVQKFVSGVYTVYMASVSKGQLLLSLPQRADQPGEGQ